MTKLSFEDAVAELVDHMVVADPIEQELVMLKLRYAIADAKSPALKAVTATDEEYFDNVPI